MTPDELDRAINFVLQHSAELDGKLQQVAAAMMRLTEIAEIGSRRLDRQDSTQALYDAMLARDAEARARQEAKLASHDADLARHNEMLTRYDRMIARYDQKLAQHDEDLARHDEILRRQEETQAGVKRLLDRLMGSS